MGLNDAPWTELVMYARESHPMYRSRLEEICWDLAGPVRDERAAPADPGWESHAAVPAAFWRRRCCPRLPALIVVRQGGRICKRSLLEEMLPVISTNTSLQKLAEQLHEHLQGDPIAPS